MDGYSDVEQQAAYNMGGFTNWRAHKWLDNADNARFLQEPNEWYKCLGNVYLTVRPLVAKKKRVGHVELRKEIEVALNDHNRRKKLSYNTNRITIPMPRAIYDLLDKWDEMIRDDMTSAKMYMKMGDDANHSMS